MVRFQILSTDAFAQAEFVRPVFELLRDPMALGDHICRSLAMQVSPAAMRYLHPTETLLEARLTFPLSGLSSEAVIRSDRIDVRTVNHPHRPSPADFAGGVIALTNAVLGYSKSIALARVSGGVTYTGVLLETTTKEFLARYVTAPRSKAGTYVGAGVAFYFGEIGDEPRTTVTFDRWPPSDNGFFLRVFSLWDVRPLPLDQLSSGGYLHITEVLSQLAASEVIEMEQFGALG